MKDALLRSHPRLLPRGGGASVVGVASVVPLFGFLVAMSSYWIEGIGNEVIASCALSAAVVILFLYLSRRLVQARLSRNS